MTSRLIVIAECDSLSVQKEDYGDLSRGLWKPYRILTKY